MAIYYAAAIKPSTKNLAPASEPNSEYLHKKTEECTAHRADLHRVGPLPRGYPLWPRTSPHLENVLRIRIDKSIAWSPTRAPVRRCSAIPTCRVRSRHIACPSKPTRAPYSSSHFPQPGRFISIFKSLQTPNTNARYCRAILYAAIVRRLQQREGP